MMFFHSTVNSLITMDMLEILGEKGVGRRAKKVKKNLMYKPNLNVHYKYEKVNSAL